MLLSRVGLVAVLFAAVAWGQAPPAADPNALPQAEDRKEKLPDEFAGVGVDEQLGDALPLDLKFVDSEGRDVTLADYFDGDKPIILTLNYYRCPQLCGLQLNALVSAMQDMEWVAGREFEIVTISFDPLETANLAKLKKRNYMESYGKPEAVGGWHFLTGESDAIKSVLETTGFKIRWSEERREWIHTAALIFCTPEGKISRYLYGLVIKPKTVRLSLVEAGEGKIGSPMDKVLLFCYHFDPETGSYQASVFNLVRAAALMSLLGVGALLFALWRFELRRRKTVAAET